MPGPREGNTPYVGTLSDDEQYALLRALNSVKELNQVQLDFLIDDKANSIGALLYHLAATDAYYHLHTFQGLKWNSWDQSYKKKWAIAMDLGEPARKQIKGNDLNFYSICSGKPGKIRWPNSKNATMPGYSPMIKIQTLAKSTISGNGSMFVNMNPTTTDKLNVLAKRVPGAKPEN